ncbi:MAG TPA: hypothetical protein VL492_11010 [Methylovirgula sp.]|nr:hypothetical protein [Methylovirgula sp.]
MSDDPQSGAPPKASNVTSLAEARALPQSNVAQSKKPSSAIESDDTNDGHNPWAVVAGAAVVLGLLVGTWLLIDSTKCNPMFSDAGLYHSRACR